MTPAELQKFIESEPISEFLEDEIPELKQFKEADKIQEISEKIDDKELDAMVDLFNQIAKGEDPDAPTKKPKKSKKKQEQEEVEQLIEIFSNLADEK